MHWNIRGINHDSQDVNFHHFIPYRTIRRDCATLGLTGHIARKRWTPCRSRRQRNRRNPEVHGFVHSSVDFDENRHCAVCTPQIAGGCNSGETGRRPKRDFARNAGLLGGCGRIAYRHLKRRHFDAGECHRVAKEVVRGRIVRCALHSEGQPASPDVVFADADLFSYRRPQRVQASRLGPAHHPSILVAWRVEPISKRGQNRQRPVI
jgi:hypothetical protein